MNPTLMLLRTIGSPYCKKEERQTPKNSEEAFKLYDYAKKNKIGLMYLTSIKDQGKLEKLNLKNDYESERTKHDNQRITAVRISSILNSFNINYAVFKSIMPFPATPNDVDIIHFGPKSDYAYAREKILESNYMEVKGYVDAEQCMFHDIKFGGLIDPHPEKKDVFDVDLYQKISASHVIYLDKEKLKKYICCINMSGAQIMVLNPEAELITIIIHSLIPEMLCTLFVYYATIYYLKQMKSENINQFIKIARENHVVNSVKAHLSLVGALHSFAHGFVPNECARILSELGKDEIETGLLIKSDFRTPHMYSSSAVFKALLEKMKESRFRRSALRQCEYMLLNPKLCKWVLCNLVWRRTRETY